jgi:hypothetical protein
MTMKTNYVWIRRNHAPCDIFEESTHKRNERIKNYNDWFLAIKLDENFYQSFSGNQFWVQKIEVSTEAVTRPYNNDELHELYEQEDELKKIFSIL